MSGQGTRLARRAVIWGVLALALVLQLVLVASTSGVAPDINVLEQMTLRIADDPLHVYLINDPTAPSPAWPYPSGAFPVLGLVHTGSVVTGISALTLIRVPLVLANIGLAWLAWFALRRRGASPEKALLGLAVVAFGPCLIFVSAVHGQLDALAYLPALAAVVLWEFGDPRTRAVKAGALIGLAAAVKGVPGLVLLALLPTVNGRREAAALVTAAVAVPLALMAPFVLATPESTLAGIREYRGIPGRAGLSLLVDPDLALLQLNGTIPTLGTVPTFLLDHPPVVLLPALLGVTLLLRRARVDAASSAAAILLTFCVFSPAVLPQYWLWPIPFLVAAGRVYAAAALQLLLLPALLAIYNNTLFPTNGAPRLLDEDLVTYGYVPIVFAATALMMWLLFTLVRGQSQRQPALRRAAGSERVATSNAVAPQ